MGAYEDDEPSFFQKHRLLIAGGGLAALAIALWLGKGRFDTSRARSEQRMVMIDLPPPPPPSAPPPPPTHVTPPPQTEQKMMEQEPVSAEESKPDATPANDSPALGTSIQGDGPPDGFGLRGGNSFGGGSGKASHLGRSSRWGWYASQVQSAISQALQGNHDTRTADFRSVVQIWADRTGRITRARLAESTGNGALDNAITNDVLVGHVLQEPPPEGMPMPIVMRLTARHAQASLSRQYP